jgi:hypothetical protein
MTAPPSDDLSTLRATIESELRTPVRPGVEWLARVIAERHGATVSGVLFYGSGLRDEHEEGVLDFWVVVDDYAAAHDRALHALANRIAPPNVYYLERELEGQTLRSKYGVIDRRDFAQGTSLGAWHPYVWARFAQPARLIACRDDDARAFFASSLADAVVTLVARLVCWMPARGGQLRFSLAAFWQEAFRRTYDSERRPEAEDSIRALYRADPDRYDAVAAHALTHLAREGHLARATPYPRSFEVEMAPASQRLQRLRWRAMRSVGRVVGLVRLAKTAFTFGDWVPYVLWKLERHTGRRIELTERQRRHPLLFAWPIILPLLLRRNLR